MSLAMDVAAESVASHPAPSRPARSPGNVRGPVLLVLVMAVIATGIGLFVAATEKHSSPIGPAVVISTTTGTGGAPLAVRVP